VQFLKELGNRLLLVREKLGISIEELANATRIEQKYLLAIERGDFDLLPGPIYIRSYLRTYAIYVELDPKQIVRLYQEQEQVISESLSRTTRVQREMESTLPNRKQKQDFSRSSGKMVTMSRTAVRNPSKLKEKKSGFAKFYTGFLITGFLLLLIVAGVVFYLRSTTTKVAEPSDKVFTLTATVTHVMLRTNF
jgi:cytoskeletal protein RodZ